MAKRTRLSRAESAAETRRALLDAAAVAFARKGYGGASVHEIAELAGRTTGALYAHFAGKDDLFLALLRERLDSKLEALSAIGSIDDTKTKGRALAHRFSNLAEIEGGDWALLATEFWLYAARNARARKALARFHEETRRGIADVLEAELARRGRRSRIPARELAAVVIAIGDGLGQAKRVDPGAVPGALFARAVDAVLVEFSVRGQGQR